MNQKDVERLFEAIDQLNDSAATDGCSENLAVVDSEDLKKVVAIAKAVRASGFSDQPRQLGESVGTQDFYVLSIDGDVEPRLIGPFKSKLDRDVAASGLQSEEGSLHKLSVPAGIELEVEAYTDFELNSNTVEGCIEIELDEDRDPITNVLDGDRFFAAVMGEEVLITRELLGKLEKRTGEPFVILTMDNGYKTMLPRNVARSRMRKLSREEWVAAVSKGETDLALNEWKRDQVNTLPLAVNIIND